MSGGSYNYICFAEPDDMLNRRHHVNDMSDGMRFHGKLDAARELHRYYQDLVMFSQMIEFRHKRLEKVMHAFEWWSSGDLGEDQFDMTWQEFLEGKQ